MPETAYRRVNGEYRSRWAAAVPAISTSGRALLRRRRADGAGAGRMPSRRVSSVRGVTKSCASLLHGSEPLGGPQTRGPAPGVGCHLLCRGPDRPPGKDTEGRPVVAGADRLLGRAQAAPPLRLGAALD